MANAIFKVPEPVNEPSLSYAPGNPEHPAVKQELAEMLRQEIDIPRTLFQP